MEKIKKSRTPKWSKGLCPYVVKKPVKGFCWTCKFGNENDLYPNPCYAGTEGNCQFNKNPKEKKCLERLP